MNIFDIGPMEMVVIVAAALIIFGPQRLPEVLGTLGRTIGQIRRMAEEATREFSRELNIEAGEPPQYQYTAPIPPPPAYVPPLEPPVTPSEAEAIPIEGESPINDEPATGGYSLLKSDDPAESNSIGGSLEAASSESEQPPSPYEDLGIHSDFTVPEETEDTPVEFKPSYEVDSYSGPVPQEVLVAPNGHIVESEDAPKPPRRRRSRKKAVEVEEVESV